MQPLGIYSYETFEFTHFLFQNKLLLLFEYKLKAERYRV
jgi:hypothetical protein